jgi:hypothetical protein
MHGDITACGVVVVQAFRRATTAANKIGTAGKVSQERCPGGFVTGLQ